MVNTLGYLTAIVLAFSAFVAFKNKEEYTNQKQITENESSKRDRNQKKFEGLVDEIAGLESERDTANQSRDDFAAKLEEQEAKNEQVSKESEEAKSSLEETASRLAGKAKELEELGEIRDLGPKIEGLTISIQELEDKLAILNTENSRLRGQKTESGTRLATIKKKLSDITSGRSLPSMKTRISAISRTLGFVTLGGGINSGVIGGSKVAVVRGGEKIAELNVTAVSTNTATADIILSTLKKGEQVSVGDTVIPVEGAGS